MADHSLALWIIGGPTREILLSRYRLDKTQSGACAATKRSKKFKISEMNTSLCRQMTHKASFRLRGCVVVYKGKEPIF